MSLLIVGNTGSTTLGTMLFVSISFLILMLLIKKFAWGSISNMLETRANKIANDLDSAEDSRIKAAELEKQRNDELLESKNEAAGIIKQAKTSAEKTGLSMIDDARNEAAQIKTKAKKDISIEREQALNSAKVEVADLSIQIAEKILTRELSKEDHTDLINSYIEGLGNNHED